jgi:hypothetical protein
MQILTNAHASNMDAGGPMAYWLMNQIHQSSSASFFRPRA